MKRREFIALVGGAAALPFARPLTAHAQSGARMRRIGVLMGLAENDPDNVPFLTAFREELQKFGWAEERNIRVEIRSASAEGEQIQRAVQELMALQPEVIVTQNTPTTVAMRQQTRTIPIVFANVSDPIGEGFVASLPRPGGNVTGFIDVEAAMGGKWLELLKEISPRIIRVALPFNPATAPRGGSYFLGPLKAAAASLGIEAIAAPVGDTSELEAVIAAQAQASSGGLVVIPDSFLRNRRDALVALTARYRIPAIYPTRYYSEFGGLMSYGNEALDNWRRTASYVDRILKGEKPGELPVQVPVKFELVINLKTAKALDIDVPWILEQRADRVIE
jgi:putative ABC transport system substrate-binding protein